MNTEAYLNSLREFFGEYSGPYSVKEHAIDNDLSVEEVDSEITGQSRWSVQKRNIFYVEEIDAYIGFSWSDPATEGQEGQPLNPGVFEVEPYEETVTKYRSIN